MIHIFRVEVTTSHLAKDCLAMIKGILEVWFPRGINISIEAEDIDE